MTRKLESSQTISTLDFILRMEDKNEKKIEINEIQKFQSNNKTPVTSKDELIDSSKWIILW